MDNLLIQYIADLPIAQDARPLLAESEDESSRVDIDALPEALVSGSNLVGFEENIDPQVRSVATLSLLAAQRVADSDPVIRNPDQWVARYNTVLENLNWVRTGGGFTRKTYEDTNLAVHKAIIPFLQAAFVPGAAATALIVTALKQLQEADQSSPWITLFSRESQRFEVSEFQFTTVSTEGDDTVLRLAAARFDASYGKTQVLFFKLKDLNATFELANSRLQSNSELLQEMNNALKIKLAHRTNSYIKSVGPL